MYINELISLKKREVTRSQYPPSDDVICLQKVRTGAHCAKIAGYAEQRN